MELLADTTFLIDLWRDQRQAGPAASFAKRCEGLALGIPWVVAGEFMSGAVTAGHGTEDLERFLLRYVQVHSSELITRTYASLYAYMRKKAVPIGANDLWIAACAAAHHLPLVTRNVKDFANIPGVEVIDYGKAHRSESG